MDLLPATKFSSALPPRLEIGQTLRSRERFFSSQNTCHGSSVPFQRPESVVSSSLNSRRIPFAAVSCSSLPGKHASMRQSDTCGEIVSGDSLLRNSLVFQIPLSVMSVLCFPGSSLASDVEQISEKISVESVLESVDNFFIRYPFVAAGVSVVWLVLVPLGREYLKKYKYISAIDAFVKLKDDPSCQLLDIRKEQSRNFLDSPDLKSLNKTVVQAEFSEVEEAAFVAKILKNLRDPSNTYICVLDNFDDNSLKVAELLVKNGFKEAYAIKGGLRGKDGWQMIQETLLPPDVRVYPREKKSSPSQMKTFTQMPQVGGNGSVNAEGDMSATKKKSERSSSPYPNYPDLKPPSSPTPSKP